jgi:hypothetical protein
MSLNFPPLTLQTQNSASGMQVFDPIRKKYFNLTPEEEVRQSIIQLLVLYLGVPAGLIAVERQIKYGKLKKRPDVVVFSKASKPLMIIECKAPEININQFAAHQIATYNKVLCSPFLLISNGLVHYCYRYHKHLKEYKLDTTIPDFIEMNYWAIQE